MGLSATFFITRGDSQQKRLAGFFNARLRKGQKLWLPCELEALCIMAAVKYYDPYLIQSRQPPTVLTDSKACVQAANKLERGEFSTSPRITTFLPTITRYQVQIYHLPGTDNAVSDYGSRHTPECSDSKCQVCRFVKEIATATVQHSTVSQVQSANMPLPYTNRPAWLAIQKECPDLRKTHSLLNAGTSLGKKATHQGDIKRYLRVAIIAKDDLLVVVRQSAFQNTTECIIVPQKVLAGILPPFTLNFNTLRRHNCYACFPGIFMLYGPI